MRIIGYTVFALFLISVLFVFPVVSINGYFIEQEKYRVYFLIASMTTSIALWSAISQSLFVAASEIYGFSEFTLGRLSIKVKKNDPSKNISKRFSVVLLLLSVALSVHWFAIIYGVISVLEASSFNAGSLSFSSSLYFSFLAMTNSLNGDILPASDTARLLTVIQMISGMFYAVFFFSILASFIREGRGN
jgi:hypothetical protein